MGEKGEGEERKGNISCMLAPFSVWVFLCL